MNKLLIALVLVGMLLLTMPAAILARTQNESVDFVNGRVSQMVEDKTRRVLDGLNTRRLEFNQDREAFKDFVADALDIDRNYCAWLMLGKHMSLIMLENASSETERLEWAMQHKEDIATVFDTLSAGFLESYSAILLDFTGWLEVRVINVSPMPNPLGTDARIVRSHLVRHGHPPISLDYMLHYPDYPKQWRIFDVMIDGVSIVQTFRNLYDTKLQNKSLSEVATEMRNGQF